MTDADRDRFLRSLDSGLTGLGLSLTPEQKDRLAGHFGRVIQANERFNLTRITSAEAFAIKQVVDSLAFVRWLATEADAVSADGGVNTILDVGTGAGFPALPIAVALPDWGVTAIDGTAKKVRFVASCAAELALRNLQCLHARAESLGPDRPFGYVLFKAVGPMARCLLLARTWLAKGSATKVVMYKTDSIDPTECDEATRQAAKLGLSKATQFEYTLDPGGETIRRALWVFRAGA